MTTLNIPIGSRVWIEQFPIRHYGRYLDQGFVAHNSKKSGRVSIETLEDFAEGKQIFFQPSDRPIDISEMWERATSLIGENYSLLGFNCEHFDNWVATGKPSSKQLEWGAMGAAGAVLYASTKGMNLRQTLILSAVFGIGGLLLANATD